jgi:carboxymethylenebutenolidase
MGMITATEQRIQDLNVYLARPAEATTGGMLLLPSLGGLGPQLRRYADDIASAGVTALAWDHFRGQSPADLSFEERMARVSTITDDAAHAEQLRLLDYLFKDLGLAKAGVIGWCMGGRYALLLAARDHRLANCVAYHPTIRRPMPANHSEDAVARAAAIECPVQVMVPGADQIVPAAIFAELAQTLEHRPTAASIIHTYPGAEHAFMDRHDTSEPNRIATVLAWPQTLAFIRATVL